MNPRLGESFEAVIATLYKPWTLQPLVDNLRDHGVIVHVIEGMFTNEAWNEGLSRVTRPFAIVANDDILIPETRSGDWLGRLAAHHAAGFTWVSPRMYWERRLSLGTRHPLPGGSGVGDLGHFFSMNRAIAIKPIPSQLKIAFGDDWFFEHHAAFGRCCRALDLVVVTGRGMGHDDHSGYTICRARAEGRGYDAVQAADGIAAWEIFRRLPTGRVLGLKTMESAACMTM